MVRAIIEAETTMAEIFIPRGRALAAVTGARWPDALERATLRHVEEAIGVTVAAGAA